MLDVGQGDGYMRPHLCMLLFLWVVKVPIHRKAVLDQTHRHQARAGAVQRPNHPAIETIDNYKDPTQNAHRTYHKWFGILFSSNKWMQSCLLGRPSSHGIEVQQTLTEINERCSIVQFWCGISTNRCLETDLHTLL